MHPQLRLACRRPPAKPEPALAGNAMSSERTPIQRHLLALASCLVLVLLAIAFVDRPVSTWSHDVLRRPAVLDALTHIVDPFPPAAAIGLMIAGCAAAFGGWKPGETGLTLVACCVSVIAAIAIKEQLKYGFGRTWPDTWVNHNPSWIVDRAFGFHPFHGGQGWYSFPSGHTTIICSAMAVLWIRVRPLRWLWLSLILAVVVGLLGSDYHWVSDMIAGAYLGCGTAVGVLALFAHLRGRA